MLGHTTAMPQIMYIRSAKIEDLEAILEIYNDVILNSTAVYQNDPHTIEMRLEWYQDRIRNGYPVVVAELNGCVIGFASYGPFRTAQGYQFTVEHSLYLHQDYRGRGFAKPILQWLVYDAREKGYHVMLGVIDSSNEASIRLHAKCGFEDCGSMKQVGFKFGKWLDVAFMQLILNS